MHIHITAGLAAYCCLQVCLLARLAHTLNAAAMPQAFSNTFSAKTTCANVTAVAAAHFVHTNNTGGGTKGSVGLCRIAAATGAAKHAPTAGASSTAAEESEDSFIKGKLKAAAGPATASWGSRDAAAGTSAAPAAASSAWRLLLLALLLLDTSASNITQYVHGDVAAWTHHPRAAAVVPRQVLLLVSAHVQTDCMPAAADAYLTVRQRTARLPASPCVL
jgi:hypothetical protein